VSIAAGLGCADAAVAVRRTPGVCPINSASGVVRAVGLARASGAPSGDLPCPSSANPARPS
jgi:hypothetical protein